MPKSRNLGNGFGTALKPAHEPIVLARKPISEPTIAANMARWGTGALNIDGCRIDWGADKPSQEDWNRMGSSGQAGGGGRLGQVSDGQKSAYAAGLIKVPAGRWPANVAMDSEAGEVLDAQTGVLTSGKMKAGTQREGIGYRGGLGCTVRTDTIGDSGGASRFFYCGKASKRDRRGSAHPTVKPINLMRWLCRLVTPPGGVILDPFAGSGTTGEAALLEGFVPLLCEREAAFAADCRRRLDEVLAERR